MAVSAVKLKIQKLRTAYKIYHQNLPGMCTMLKAHSQV